MVCPPPPVADPTGGWGARNIKSMRLPLVAIFFMTNFYRAGGAMAPLPSPAPPGSATAPNPLDPPLTTTFHVVFWKKLFSTHYSRIQLLVNSRVFVSNTDRFWIRSFRTICTLNKEITILSLTMSLLSAVSLGTG